MFRQLSVIPPSLLLVLSLLSSSSSAQEQILRDRWIEVRSDNFHIYSQKSSRQRNQFSQGSMEFDAEDFNEARKSFQREGSLKEEQPDFYYALAGTYLRLGNEPEARCWADTAGRILSLHDIIYQPGNNKVKVIDSSTILRDSSPGFSVFAQGSRKSRN